MMRRLWNVAASYRSAAVLIGTAAFQIFLSALIPQQRFGVGRVIGSEDFLATTSPVIKSLQLNHVYTSYLFLLTLALLMISLVAGNLRRLRRWGRLRGTRRRLTCAGSLLFHFSLLIIVIGVGLNATTRFDGVLSLTEGQVVRDRPEVYRDMSAGPLASRPGDRFELQLMDLTAGESGRAQLRVSAPGGALSAVGEARINHPMRWREWEIHLGLVKGYAPEIVLWDGSGPPLLRAFVRVSARQTADEPVVHEDFLDQLGGGRRLRIRVAPESAEMPPQFDLAILQNEVVLAAGRAVVGDTLQLAGTRVTVPRWRRWGYLYVVHNPWLNLVFAGFWLALSGQAISAVARVAARKGRTA